MIRTSEVKEQVKPIFPVKKPLMVGDLTKEQLDAEIAKGMADIENGRVYSADEVEAEMHRLYGI